MFSCRVFFLLQSYVLSCTKGARNTLFPIVIFLCIQSVQPGCTTLDPVVSARLRTLDKVMQGVDVRFRSAALGLITRDVDTAYIMEILHAPKIGRAHV